MGHVGMHDPYGSLQERLDRMPIGAPAHPALFEILRELFTTEECRIAAAMPMRPATAGRIARAAGLSAGRTEEVLRALVEKGLVVDFARPDGRVQWFLNPAVIGFFEFTMMRVRTEIDQQKVARLMWRYLREDPDRAFGKMLFAGPTFLARPLAHEDALEPDVVTEVLDYEKASEIIDGAGSWAEGLCHCRHVKLHLGQRCAFPLDHCLALGMGAEYLVRAGIAKRIDKARARDILVYAREHDAVQMGDNVRKRPTFICNCCRCCCEMLDGFRVARESRHVITSNYVARVAPEECTGCGSCAEACPIGVIDMRDGGGATDPEHRDEHAVVNGDLCLGCGVCHRHCPSGALRLRPIGARAWTPETQMVKMVTQAVERGKLGSLLFHDPTNVTHRVLSRVLGAIFALPPARRLLAQQQIKSRFVGMILDGFSRTRHGWSAKL